MKVCSHDRITDYAGAVPDLRPRPSRLSALHDAGWHLPARTNFRMRECERTETVIAEAPMKSEKADWLARAWTYSRVSNREWVRA